MTQLKNRTERTFFLSKREISVTGELTSVVKTGSPAMYLYQGNLIRTSTVEKILEVAPGYIKFETRNSIYMLSFHIHPDSGFKAIA